MKDNDLKQFVANPAQNRPIKKASDVVFKKRVISNKKKVVIKKTFFDKFFNFGIFSFIVLLLFFFPLFFIPQLASSVEMSKQSLLIFLGGLAFLLWVLRVAWRNDINFLRHFVLLPVLLFLVSSFLSAIFSDYSEQSFWGVLGLEAYSFVSLFFSVVVFFIVLNVFNYEKIKRLTLTIFLGFFLWLVFYMFELFGLLNDVSFLSGFQVGGSVYSFALILVPFFISSLVLFFGERSKILRSFLFVFIFVSFFSITAINFKLVWILLLIMLTLFFGFLVVKDKKQANSPAKILPMFFLILAILLSFREQSLFLKDLPVAVNLNQKTSLEIAVSAFKKDPLFGAGLGSYSSVYKLFRPESLGDFWSVNFNTGASYFLTLFATAGIFSTVSFLFLVAYSVYIFFKKLFYLATKEDEKEDYFKLALSLFFFSLTILYFVYPLNMVWMFFWWVSFALFLRANFSNKDEGFVFKLSNPKSSLVLSFVFVFTIILIFSAMYVQSQKVLASYHFKSALAFQEGDDLERIIEHLDKSVSLDSSNDLYYREEAMSFFALSVRVLNDKKEELNAEDSARLSSLIKQSLFLSQKAIDLNSNNSDNFLTQARIYEGFLFTMKGSDEKVVDAYQKAIDLDPNNPELLYRLANVYVSLSDYDSLKKNKNEQENADVLSEESKKNLALARQSLEKAISINKFHKASNILMANVYEREGEIDLALNKKQENVGLFPVDSDVIFDLGFYLYRQGKENEAGFIFEQAIALNPNHSNARYLLALIYDKKGNKELALEYFKKIQDLSPDNQEIPLIIENLLAGKSALHGIGSEVNNLDEFQDGSTDDLGEDEIEDLEESEVNARIEGDGMVEDEIEEEE